MVGYWNKQYFNQMNYFLSFQLFRLLQFSCPFFYFTLDQGNSTSKFDPVSRELVVISYWDGVLKIFFPTRTAAPSRLTLVRRKQLVVSSCRAYFLSRWIYSTFWLFLVELLNKLILYSSSYPRQVYLAILSGKSKTFDLLGFPVISCNIWSSPLSN